MDKTTEFVEEIDRNPHNVTYDEHCKKILCNKQILSRIIKECVSEFHDIPLAEIPDYIVSDPATNMNVDKAIDQIYSMNPEDTSVFGAKVIFDIIVGIRLPNSPYKENIDLILNIEAQANGNTSYPLVSRAIYYCSRLLARQKNRPVGFQHSEYQNLKKVYSIWIVMNSKKATEGVMNQYSISETCLKRAYHFPKETYDKLTIIMIYPKSKYDMNDDKYDLMELLHILFKAEMTAKEKKCQLKQNYGIMMIKKTEREVEGMCNLSQVYIDEGIKKGMMKGFIEGQSNIVMNMMKTTNKTANEVMKMLGIDKEIQPEINKFINAQTNGNI